MKTRPDKALHAVNVNPVVEEMDRGSEVCQSPSGNAIVASAPWSKPLLGFGYNLNCAVAATGPCSHHIIVVGTNHQDMAQAANTLSEIGGGVVVVSNGEELARVELVIAGLMSDEPAEIVAAKAEKMVAAMKACGCNLNNAFMQHSLLALVVIRKCAFRYRIEQDFEKVRVS